MSAPSRMLYDRSLERRRYLASRRRRTMPAPPQVYTPRLRDEQVKALRVLKEIDGRPMTKLVQEALDRYLEPYGGVDGLLEGGVASPTSAVKQRHNDAATADGARPRAPAVGNRLAAGARALARIS